MLGDKPNLKLSKSLWLAVKSNEMLRDSMHAFVRELKSGGTDYVSYATTGKYVYIEILNPNENVKQIIHSWTIYHPITILKKRPNVSDYDRVDW